MTLEIHLDLLKKCADGLEQRFLCPVYLVGSFQTRYKDARDIDIIMVIGNERLKRLFGSIYYNDRRFQFNRKQKLYLEEFITDFDIDFKVQTESEFEAHEKNSQALKLGKYAWIPQ